MPLNRPILIDQTPINGESGITVWISKGGTPPSQTDRLRDREGFYAAYEGSRVQPRRLPISIERNADSEMGQQEFDSYIRGLFRVSSTPRTITSERDGIEYTIDVRITELDRPRVNHWVGEILVVEPEWLGPLVSGVSASPLEVEGNVDTRPVIRITDGLPAIRRRLTIRDQSGNGISSWPIAIDVSEDGLSAENYQVFLNALPQPYHLEDGWLYLRVAGKSNEATYIDILSAESITNEVDFREFVDGGLNLDPSINAGTLTIDPEQPWGNPKSASLSFHPGIAGEHNDQRRYTFGFDGDGILRLIDTEATGRSWNLKNNADAYMLSSPVPITQISGLKLRAFSGFRAGRGSSKSGDRLMRVTIQDALGNLTSGPIETHTYVLELRRQYGTERHRDRSFYATFNMGGINFPNTRVAREVPVDDEVLLSDGSPTNTYWKSGTLYREDYLPGEFGALAAKHIGCPVTQGKPGEWFLHFPENAYGGINIPFPSMSIQPKSGRVQVSTFIQPVRLFVDHAYGDSSLENVLIMNCEWVDPVTKKPLGSNADNTPMEDMYGAGRVVVWYWLEDSELPYVAFSRKLTGASKIEDIPNQPNVVHTLVDGGIEYEITVPALNLPGAVKVAVGIAPESVSANMLDWATMYIENPVSVQVDGSKLPDLIVSEIPAQRLHGVIVNEATGHHIRLSEVYSDASGLEIDCSKLRVRGVSGVGMVYGEFAPTGALRWFDLPVGDVEWDTQGDLSSATIEFDWHPRLVGNS